MSTPVLFFFSLHFLLHFIFFFYLDELAKVSSLLKVEVEQLNQALCFRNIGTRSVIMVPYSIEQAADARDALTKALYGRLFDWLIEKINQSLNPNGVDPNPNTKSIGVLDIFGFESFETNSFEQLCINYCNEKLQFHFNDHIFRLEQVFYIILPLNTLEFNNFIMVFGFQLIIYKDS